MNKQQFRTAMEAIKNYINEQSTIDEEELDLLLENLFGEDLTEEQ